MNRLLDRLSRWWWARRYPHVSYDNKIAGAVRADLPPLAFPEEFARKVTAIYAGEQGRQKARREPMTRKDRDAVLEEAAKEVERPVSASERTGILGYHEARIAARRIRALKSKPAAPQG